MVIQVKLMCPKGETKIVDLCENEEQLRKITVKQFKETTVKYFPTAEAMVFIFGDKRLEEDELLVSYGIGHMSAIYAVVVLPGGIR